MGLIANMDLSDKQSRTLNLHEFRNIADAMGQMKQGLRNFQKFVPGDVVREMLRRNVGVKLGVTTKRLTIMFLDLANFTTMSEQVHPNVLIALLSEFFTEMSQAVMATGGTVDKFIG
jgi:adenylate cyclase